MNKSTTTIDIDIYPSIYSILTMTKEERSKIIELGLSLYNDGIKKIEMMSNVDWEKRIEEIENSYNMSIKELEGANENLKQRITEITNEFSREKNEISAKISENVHLSFKNQIELLKSHNDNLLEKINNQHNIIQDEVNKKQNYYEDKIKELRDFYEIKLNNLLEQQNKLRDEYENKINTITTRTQNSTFRGKDGEEELYHQLNLIFPTAEIEDTHSMPTRGDFIMRINDLVIMIENKNYTKNVQKCEIDKFYRDIENPSNSDVKCGIFISMNTGICAKEDFTVEVRNGKPIIFLHKIRENINHIRIAVSFFSLLLSYNNIDLSSTELKTSINNMAKNMKRSFQKQKTRLDKYYKEQIVIIEEQESQTACLYSLLKMNY